MKTYKSILSTIFALTLTLTMLTSCGETAETPAESKGETTTTATEVSEVEATTTTTTEAIEDSEPEVKKTTTEAITTSEPETTTEPEVTTTEVTTPEKDELLSVEECIKWLVSERVGEEVEITNIDCDEITGRMSVTFNNGMVADTNNVASHYAAGDKTSLENYNIGSGIKSDYFITYYG